MRALLIFLLAWAVLAAAGPAEATGRGYGYRGGSIPALPGTCSIQSLTDGCSANPMIGVGNFLNPGFFTVSSTVSDTGPMLQSGQSALKNTPISDGAWNVAGVSPNYTLGVPAAFFTGSISSTALTVASAPNRPLNFNCATDCDTLDEMHGAAQGTHIIAQVDGIPGGIGHYTVDTPQNLGSTTLYAYDLYSPDQLPAGNGTGCGYVLSDGAFVAPALNCTAGAPVLTRIDFSAGNKCRNAGVTGCVSGRATLLNWNAAISSITLNYLKVVPDQYTNHGTGASSTGFSFQIGGFNSGALTNVPVSGVGGIYEGCASPDVYCPAGFNRYLSGPTSCNGGLCYPGVIFNQSSATGSWDLEYPVLLNVDGRFITRSKSGSGDVYKTRYAYICGEAYGPSAPHGELEIAGVSAVSVSFQDSYSTVCQPANVQNNMNGLVTPGNTYSGQAFVDGFAAGSLSALPAGTSQVILDANSNIPAGTHVSFYGTGTTGSNCTTGATPTTATCLGITANATGSSSGNYINVYGGSISGNASTAAFALWGGNGLTINVSVTDTEVDHNSIIINQSRNFGDPNPAATCPVPSSHSLGPCFVTNGTAVAELQFATYGATNNWHDNYIVATGSFFLWSIPQATLTGASVVGNTLTSANGAIVVNTWLVDSAAGGPGGGPGLGGGAPLVVTSSPSGSGPFTYTVSGPGTVNTGVETIYNRAAVITNSANNKMMVDGSVCNPPWNAANDSGCAGVHP